MFWCYQRILSMHTEEKYKVPRNHYQESKNILRKTLHMWGFWHKVVSFLNYIFRLKTIIFNIENWGEIFSKRTKLAVYQKINFLPICNQIKTLCVVFRMFELVMVLFKLCYIFCISCLRMLWELKSWFSFTRI